VKMASLVVVALTLLARIERSGYFRRGISVETTASVEHDY
jgi:hypothetical protein